MCSGAPSLVAHMRSLLGSASDHVSNEMDGCRKSLAHEDVAGTDMVPCSFLVNIAPMRPPKSP